MITHYYLMDFFLCYYPLPCLPPKGEIRKGVSLTKYKDLKTQYK